MGKERLKHPTQKPLWLLRRLVSLCTEPGDIVLDPYAGVASTGEACQQLGRDFIGIENDEISYIQGKNRLSQGKESQSL
jgi:DNA modification methylase